MQIVSLEQCFSRQKGMKKGKQRENLSVIYSTSTNYETFSYLAYLPPTATLVIYMRVMRGTL